MKIPFKLNVSAGLLMVGRILLGGVFVYASLDKIRDPAAFAEIIANYQILPPVMANGVALGLPWLELVCGTCLIANWWTRGSALIVSLLMGVFMAGLGYNMHRGIDVACGCFTLTGRATHSMWLYLSRDMVLLVLAIAVLTLPKTRQPLLAIFRHNETDGDAKRHVV